MLKHILLLIFISFLPLNIMAEDILITKEKIYFEIIIKSPGLKYRLNKSQEEILKHLNSIHSKLTNKINLRISKSNTRIESQNARLNLKNKNIHLGKNGIYTIRSEENIIPIGVINLKLIQCFEADLCSIRLNLFKDVDFKVTENLSSSFIEFVTKDNNLGLPIPIRVQSSTIVINLNYKGLYLDYFASLTQNKEVLNKSEKKKITIQTSNY